MSGAVETVKEAARMTALDFVLPGAGTIGVPAVRAVEGLMPQLPGGGIPAAPEPKAMPTMDDESLKAARRRAAMRMVATRRGRESTITTGTTPPAGATLGGN